MLESGPRGQDRVRGSPSPSRRRRGGPGLKVTSWAARGGGAAPGRPSAPQIYLEYEGPSFGEWDISPSCTVTNKSSPTATLHCPVPGIHKIRPKVDNETFEDVDRYLPISEQLNCFLWYVLKSSPEHSSVPSSKNDSQELILWIYDPENAEPSELNHTATSPPPNSKTLSKQFWNLGQEPVVQTYFRNTKYFATAFPELGFWKINVPAMLDDIITNIHGKAIAFQDCFVLDSPFIISRPEEPFPNNVNDNSLCSPAGSEPYIEWSACFPTTALLLSEFGTFHTNDGFITYKEIKAPAHNLGFDLSQKVTDIVLTDDGILFLIMGTVYKRESNRFFKLGSEYNLPETGITGIQSRLWCSSEYPVQSGRKLSKVAIWTPTEQYLGYDGNVFIKITDTTTLKKVLDFPVTASLSIGTVCYDSRPSEVSLLMACVGCSSSRVFYLSAYNEDRDLWVLRDFSLNAPSQGFMLMEFVYSASPSMLMWNKEMVYYSYKNNTINGFVMVTGLNQKLLEVSQGSTIHQLVIDYFGNAVIKMKNNVMIFFKVEMKNAVELPQWEKKSKNVVLYLNPSGNLYMLIINGSSIHREVYPLKTEMFTYIHGFQDICPYLVFQHSMDLNVYYLDMGDEVTFWAQIVYIENLGLSTVVEIYRPELLMQTTDVNYEIARGICTKNQTIKFYHKMDYSLEPNYTEALIASTGVMTVELQPSMSGKMCATNNKLTHFFVGCPPSRHIVIHRPSAITCIKHNFTTYKIPGEYLWDPTTEDLVVNYDWDKYGCLMDLYYAIPFHPDIALYDGSTFVETVEANFILWEIHGRSDYSYNSSMKQVGCLREAQTWISMLEEHENSTLDEIWGPQNYRSCFQSELGPLGDLNQLYQILNHSGYNSLIWPTEYSGIYVFRVKIVDPNFSFCDLNTIFAVRTYGIVESPNIGKVAGFSILILSIFGGILIVSYFRYVKIYRALIYVDPLPSHDQQDQTRKTAHELKKDQ
ncbi:cation channel sperm-associated auxiliary subunit epsilon [Gopherus flavomarginatus]|uniref:cation channel sperm-associated auxiliary subunit epsilon n=1 Tax=Gopherus flavomarginatus TaxID=286002 RepID=UPI0021CC10A1|nr:cation channel sperm-associated auxiliary subunit epsilon [Gopherus flavomarginatus]